MDGPPYRRLAGRNDHPLPPGDEKKEREKLAESIAERREESAAQRTLRRSKYQSRPECLREAWHELPEAFDFRLGNEEMLDGNNPKVPVHLRAKLWVDILSKGSRAAVEQTRVNDEVWLPRRVQVFSSARLGLLTMLNIHRPGSHL